MSQAHATTDQAAREEAVRQAALNGTLSRLRDRMDWEDNQPTLAIENGALLAIGAHTEDA